MKGDDQVKPRSEIPEILSRVCWNCKSTIGFRVLRETDLDSLRRVHDFNFFEVECKNCTGYLVYKVEKK